MTNQDSLPVWAKILLGIPANDDAMPKHADEEEHSNSSQREAAPSAPATLEQSVIVFDVDKHERKWSWSAVLCAAIREAS